MGHFKLLTVGNPKIAKGEKFGYLTAVLHLAPGNLSGFQVCPMATDGCLAACLNTAGRGGLMQGHTRLTLENVQSGIVNVIQAARIRRTRFYFESRAEFMAVLVNDIKAVIRSAARHGLIPAIRLNGTSDIPWERVAVNGAENIMALFPTVQFYDYTKRPNRRALPANYHLTFSLAENNDANARIALDNGINVAAVFRNVPDTFSILGKAFPVINADEHDLRFLDAPASIAGLKAKGHAKRDTSGFVR